MSATDRALGIQTQFYKYLHLASNILCITEFYSLFSGWGETQEFLTSFVILNGVEFSLLPVKFWRKGFFFFFLESQGIALC